MSEEVEVKARNMGWLEKDEFKGDPELWTDAAAFLERGENIMPILKERLDKMDKDLTEKTTQLEKVTGQLTKFVEHNKGT